MQKVHFRLTSVAQKRCCLGSLLLHDREGYSEKLIVNIDATIDEEYYLSSLTRQRKSPGLKFQSCSYIIPIA